MKKLLLGIITLMSIGNLAAQVEIRVDGIGPDVSGTIVDHTFDGDDIAPFEVHLIVTNNTGADQQWRVRRVRANVPGDWIDQICWPPYCYNTTGDDYLTPHTGGNPAPIIVDGSDTTTTGLLAEIKPRFTPGSSDAYALYWYYVTDLAGNAVDSVGVRIYYFLGLEDLLPTLELTVSPNPATDYIKVKAGGVTEANVKIVDLLGNVVYNKAITKESTINVMDLNNGVYFVILEAEGVKPTNKKIVVRH